MTQPHYPVPVLATRDIRQGCSTLIPRGTPGEILSTRGIRPNYYTVTFWPFGLGGAQVTVSRLLRSDLKVA